MPTEISARLPKGDKVLSWAAHGGGYLATTRRGFISTDAHNSFFVSWDLAFAATWSDPLLTIQVLDDAKVVSYSWILEQASGVPEVVRDRVSSVVVIDRVHTFTPGGQVRFVARRAGDLIVWLTLPDDLDWASSPAGATAISAELEQLRTSIGV